MTARQVIRIELTVLGIMLAIPFVIAACNEILDALASRRCKREAYDEAVRRFGKIAE